MLQKFRSSVVSYVPKKCNKGALILAQLGPKLKRRQFGLRIILLNYRVLCNSFLPIHTYIVFINKILLSFFFELKKKKWHIVRHFCNIYN